MGLVLYKPMQHRNHCGERRETDSKLQNWTSWRLGRPQSQEPAPHSQPRSRWARATDTEGTRVAAPQPGSEVYNRALLFLRAPEHLNGQTREFTSFFPIFVEQEGLLPTVSELRWWYMWTLSYSIPSGAISWMFFCSARAQSNAWAACSSKHITITPEISL